MFISRQAQKNMLASCLLAASLLLAGWTESLAVEGNQYAWAPTREDAVIVDGFPVSMLPGDSALSGSLQSRRPQSLTRPAPTRSRMYLTEAQAAGEPLPAIRGTPLGPDGLPVPSEMYYDEASENMVADDPNFGDPACCGPCGSNACGPGWGGWGGCLWIPICVFVPRPPLEGFEAFGGVQGFTGPANRGGAGSFGFHEGFNWGIPLGGFLAGQWGANWTQSNFDGNYLTSDRRNQTFVTAGLYRRIDWGLQGGLVVDYLHDDWDYRADLTQLRGELSWLWCGCNEIGFWFTAGINDANDIAIRRPIASNNGDTIRFTSTTSTLAVNEIYAFFFRRQFASGGQGRVFGGFTGHGQGLVGGDAQLPLNPYWSLRTNFIYAVPTGEDTSNDPRFTRESWNVGISLVWTPCARSASCPTYSRPLFNVADNGTFLTRLLPQ